MTVRDLLTDETKWTQGALARTKDGISVGAFDRDAACWCLKGALVLCHREGETWRQTSAWIRQRGQSLSEWQDVKGRTFAEVRALIIELDL